MTWLIDNLPQLLVAACIAVAVVLAVVHMIKNKKNGKSSCGCGCSCGGCAMRDTCHSQQKKN